MDNDVGTVLKDECFDTVDDDVNSAREELPQVDVNLNVAADGTFDGDSVADDHPQIDLGLTKGDATVGSSPKNSIGTAATTSVEATSSASPSKKLIRGVSSDVDALWRNRFSDHELDMQGYPADDQVEVTSQRSEAGSKDEFISEENDLAEDTNEAHVKIDDAHLCALADVGSDTFQQSGEVRDCDQDGVSEDVPCLIGDQAIDSPRDATPKLCAEDVVISRQADAFDDVKAQPGATPPHVTASALPVDVEFAEDIAESVEETLFTENIHGELDSSPSTSSTSSGSVGVVAQHDAPDGPASTSSSSVGVVGQRDAPEDPWDHVAPQGNRFENHLIEALPGAGDLTHEDTYEQTFDDYDENEFEFEDDESAGVGDDENGDVLLSAHADGSSAHDSDVATPDLLSQFPLEPESVKRTAVPVVAIAGGGVHSDPVDDLLADLIDMSDEI